MPAKQASVSHQDIALVLLLDKMGQRLQMLYPEISCCGMCAGHSCGLLCFPNVLALPIVPRQHQCNVVKGLE